MVPSRPRIWHLPNMGETLDMQARAVNASRVQVGAYLELIRFRIAVLVLAATTLGFVLAIASVDGAWSGSLLFHTLLGTALIAAGANSLNQVIETNLDRKMVRTRGRPIPSGRIKRSHALAFGIIVGVGGVCYLTALVNVGAGLIGAVTLGGYVLVYTPMKRVSWHSVFVGAIPGALPPVIGWTAAYGAPSVDAWLLFGIVLIWQLPHFAAIAWLHRDDYGRAGFPMLSVLDPTGNRICRHMIQYSVVLIAVSLLPVWYGLVGLGYAVGASFLGVSFLLFGLYFSKTRTLDAARLHLRVSIVYLPALFAIMLLDAVL